MKSISWLLLALMGALICGAGLSTGCRPAQPAASPALIRLNDVFSVNDIKGRPTQGEIKTARTAWKFDGSELAPTATNDAPTTFGFRAGPGSGALELRQGLLTGKATNGFPIIYVERAVGSEDLDQIHAFEIRMRVSAGSNLSLRLMGSQPLDFKPILEELEGSPWTTRTPLKPGTELQTYVITPQIFELTSRVKYVLINPTDAKDATFEIESARLIFRKEHLADIPSSGGWHGLREVYHESIAARTPERIELPLNLPAEPRLDLSIGTVQEGAVQFQIGIRQQGAAAGQEQWVLRRTVTSPHRWEPLQVDLSRFSGQSVTLTMALAGNTNGLLGFWGSPVIWNLAQARQARTQQANRPQGVILIWSDTTRWDHLNFYGYKRETAPNLAVMAKEGVLFQHCISQATWTKVATPSLMTSLYPASHGVHSILDRLPAAANTLAESFHRNGYATVSFSSLPFTGKASNLHQGFQEVHEGASLVDTPREGKNAREFVSRAMPWIERHRQLPFFMFLHLFDAHDPFEPMPPYNTLWAKPDDGDTYERMVKKIKPNIQNPFLRIFGKGMPNREEVVKSNEDPESYINIEKNWYDGSIRGMDAEIGRLRERLQELGLSDRVLIVFASDHGEEFFDHGKKMHGHTAYSEQNHVALFFAWPGAVPSGKSIPETVRTIDVMPTILELCQIDPPKDLQGQSLLPLMLQGQTASPLRTQRSWTPMPAITEKADTEEYPKTESYAIVVGQWKLIHNVKRIEPQPEFELFDWGKDPLDQNNLSAQHPDVVKQLSGEIASWKSSALAAKLPADADLVKSLSPQDLQRLRSLGYIK